MLQTATTHTRPGGHPGEVEVYVSRATVAPEIAHPHGMPGCTNGPSGDNRIALLATEAIADSYRRRGQDPHPSWFVLVFRPQWRDVIVSPLAPCPPDRIGYMHGGNTVDLTGYPEVVDALTALGADPAELSAVRIHDRSETQAQYDALSI